MTPLQEHLEGQLSRKVPREELALALGISVATLNRRKVAGFGADDAITSSRHFGISPVQTLVTCGFANQDEVDSAAHIAGLGMFSDLALANEMVRRVRNREQS